VTIPAGTTYARFQLSDADVSPASDIDMCLFTAGGALVATSGGATSEEIINRLNPAAGNYVLALNGFAVPAGGATLEAFHWVLGSTAAGNMAVSAPTSAQNGTVETVTLTFPNPPGLLPATRYLGSVAYSGVAGLPNPTIVRVNTP
jgi:hypothetical protein